MQLIDLKQSILDKQISDNFMILKWEDNSFIANTYIEAIAEVKNVDVQYIDELSVDASIFGLNNSLKVLKVENFETCKYYPDQLCNNIVVCNKYSKSIKENFGGYIVDIPKLESWQIKEYMKVRLPGLSTKTIEWLYEITSGDIYRIYNEVEKLSLFPEQIQDITCESMSKEGMYDDLSSEGLFDLTNALTRRDLDKVRRSLSIKSQIEPLVLLSVLIKQFKNIINIQLDARSTPQSLGISPKQFKAVEYSCGRYTTKELVDIYEMLTSIDYKVKNGHLDIKYVNDYVINGLTLVKN